jgi:hypothetical protein
VNDAKKSERRDLLVACTLSGPEQADRRGEVEGIFGGCLRTGELEDGHEFVFPGDAEWVVRLAEFVAFERGCCPFLTFELVFEPEGGTIRLRVRGPEGAKSLVAEMFAGRIG